MESADTFHKPISFCPSESLPFKVGMGSASLDKASSMLRPKTGPNLARTEALGVAFGEGFGEEQGVGVGVVQVFFFLLEELVFHDRLMLNPFSDVEEEPLLP
jgi:hypothetical protein